MTQKIFYPACRRSGGTYLRNFLREEYKDRCFIGYPQSRKDMDFILSDRCICYWTHLQTANLYGPHMKEFFEHVFSVYLDPSNYCMTVFRHPVKRLISGIAKSRSLLNKPINGNYGRFAFLSRIYGVYDENFREQRDQLLPPDFNTILKYMLSSIELEYPVDTEYSLWLYESLHTVCLGNMDELKKSFLIRELVAQSSVNKLPKQIDDIVSSKFNAIGVQENIDAIAKKLVIDNIISKQTYLAGFSDKPIVNTTKAPDYVIDPEIICKWFNLFPYDFTLWSYAYTNSL